MKKILFTFFVSLILLFVQNATAQEASAEMRENNKLVEKISFKEMTALNTIKPIQNLDFVKNEFQKIAFISPKISKPQNHFTKNQLKKQQKIEKFASSKVGKWVIKKLVKIQLKKELRKELRKVKGNKEAQKLLREKYTKKQMDLSTTVNMIVSVIGLIGSILVLVSNSAQISFWIGIGMMVIGLILLCVQLLR